MPSSLPSIDPADPTLLRLQQEADGEQQRMRAAVAAAAAGQNPDEIARNRRLAQYVGMPPAVGQALPAEVKTLAAVQQVQADTAQAPALARKYTEADFAALAHDDSPVLSAIEKAVRYVVSADPQGGLVRDVLGGAFYGGSAGAAGAFRAASEFLAVPLDPLEQFPAIGGNPLRRLAEGFDRIARSSAASLREMAPADASVVGGGVQSGFQSLGQNLMVMPFALLPGGQAAVLAAMGGQAGGQSYQRAREKGVDQSVAALYGMSDAAIEIGTEMLPLAKLIGDVKAGTPLFRSLFHNAMLEVPGEQIATALQDLNEWAVLNEGKPFSAYLAERPAAAAQTLIATLIGTGGQVSLMHAIQQTADAATGRERGAEVARQRAEALQEMVTLAEASKLRERDPQAFATFAQELTDEQVPALYVGAQVLEQAGVDLQAVAQALPSVAQQVQVALATGGDLVIPTAEFLTMAPGEAFVPALIEHARTAADAMSPAEAKQYMTEHGDQLQAEVQRVIEERQGGDAAMAGREEVKTAFLEQLQKAGRFTPAANEAYASMVANFYAVQGARLGITPQEMLARYPLQVAGQAVAGSRQVLQQDSIDDLLEEHGQPVATRMDAERAFNAGDRVFVMHDQGEEAREVKNVTELQAFTPDQMIVLPQGTYEQPARGQIALGRDITQTPSVITLLQGADLSTFVHEAGHFFLEVQADLAARIQQQIAEGASVTDGERQIVADMDALLSWFGVKSTPELSALDVWHTMTLEEKRSLHEQFARGFEAYAFEGQGPSLELAGVFQRFRAWLLQVYKDLKALKVELSDEVRGVMDRMLATTQQIQEAEAARKMGPLFQTPEQAGMTLQEFQAYHALAVDATQTAIANLQARGLRDMRWLTNAKSRRLKELQKLADGLRREVRRDVRAEVMAQPLYQAWQFLTGKGDAIDQADPTEREKAARGLDPTRDSLLTAIAKLGGISRESAARDLDVGPDEMKADAGVFGAPPFRKEGGMGADRMRELLTEAGYIHDRDEFGRTDLHGLRDELAAELGGDPQYSWAYDYERAKSGPRVEALPERAAFGKLSTTILRERYGTAEDAVWRTLSARRMTSDRIGVDPDVVAETFGFSSGDELVQALAAAAPPAQVIEARTDQAMLERFGDLATPEGLQRAAEQAIHNDARARFMATELAALQRANTVRGAGASGRNTVDVLRNAARLMAQQIMGRLTVREIQPGQYAAAEVRAAREAEKALAAGDTAAAAEAKRNQLIQHQAVRAAHQAQQDVQNALRYLRKFERRSKTIDASYSDQIEALLERFDLKPRSMKEVDKRRSLADWITSQREAGMEPDIPPELANEAFRTSWRDLTVEQMLGLRDTVRQIEHLGRLKNRLLTARARREFEAVRDEIAASIEANAGDRKADTRSPATVLGRKLQALRNFGWAHIKAATIARIMDGGKDGGPVWEYVIRTANERGDMESTQRAEATRQLHDIVEPLLEAGRMGGKGTFFPSIGRSMNREQVLAMALNWGNAGNQQRLLGGEGWRVKQVVPVLRSLTAAEWQAVQAIWDHFESYRPAIGAKERRVYGKEPAWVDPVPFDVVTADGKTVSMRGGYFPIRYDPAASGRAEQHNDAEDAKRQLQGAYTSATTRRGFTKSRVEEVRGRPLLYSLDAVYAGVNDVIHDLAWHEWLIDVNRILRSDKIDEAIRTHYGPAAVRQFKTWVQDIAAGDQGLQRELDTALGRLRHGVSVAGLGFNALSAAMQVLGLTQSMVRVGAPWLGKGIAQYVAGPVAATRRVNDLSEYMANRQRTRFRELAEVRDQVQGQTKARTVVAQGAYFLMMRAQQMVDVPTWLGAYEKATAEGNGEDRAISLADQAVIDAQGGGQTKDLSAIERGGPALKLFTVFYSFMNTALNMGVGQTMTAPKTAAGRAKLIADYALLYSVPAVLGAVLKDALTPGDSGDWDEWRKAMRKALAEQMSYLMGLMVVSREFAEAGKTAAGLSEHPRDYQGPAGVRLVADTTTLAKQINQGELDDSFRKAAVNLLGDLMALPAAQINRTITGAKALHEGKTQNPAALVFGFQAPR